jgi:tRNA A-37 threonylcarbamoyl transferase component Bud32
METIDSIAELDHPHVLPTYVSTIIADNFLSITPLRAETLREAIARGCLSNRRKVELLMQALSGLAALHQAGFLHRDFTLRNILVDDHLENACVFDFDLAVRLDQVRDVSYRERFQGRIFGSPGYSLAPETLDPSLMESKIAPSLDLYGAGSAIYGLFDDGYPYGEAQDMWSLLLRVSEGVVRGGQSFIEYPPCVPQAVRPVIERCLEKDPAMREGNVHNIIQALREITPRLQSERRESSTLMRTMRYGDKQARLRSVGEARKDHTIGFDLIASVDQALYRHGYQLRRALGRVKQYPIFMAAPDPELLAQGSFPDTNTYPKIVTLLDLSHRADRTEVVECWMSTYLPLLRNARQGLLTPLHRVFYEPEKHFLLLLSEYVDDARFGTDLFNQRLELSEALGLAFLVARQVERLHNHGLAHNHVCAQALLLKGYRQARRVHPAMVGIVDPTRHSDDMVRDVQALARLIQSWIPDGAVASSAPHARHRIDNMLQELNALAETSDATIGRMIEICGDGLAALDFNFGVLRESDGDLDAYALLLVSHSLYGRLWH